MHDRLHLQEQKALKSLLFNPQLQLEFILIGDRDKLKAEQKEGFSKTYPTFNADNKIEKMR